MRRRLVLLLAACAAVIVNQERDAIAGPFSDAKVQAPEVVTPSRGSLAGHYASVSFGPGDVSRGAFSLPLPVSPPVERGELPLSVFPVYSPDHGISEWGLGWAVTSLAITRSRVTGSIDYATDDRTGPWGRMVRGTDGAWYPVGLQSKVRIEETGSGLVAYQPDGSRWFFEDVITTAAGTYAWYLRTTISPTGQKSHFRYERNTSGKLFLSKVEFAGTGTEPQTEIVFHYKRSTPTLDDFNSGQALSLDRRVERIQVLTRHTQSQRFTERWSYWLSYSQAEDSSIFYLSQIQQVFSSGEKAPATTYSYHLPLDHFAHVTEHHVRKLDPVIQTYSPDILQANQSTVVDIDADGMPDLELHYKYMLLHQTVDAFVQEELPDNPQAHPACRETNYSYKDPRLLARMRQSDEDVSVVFTSADGVRSQVVLCTREGDAKFDAFIPGTWGVGQDVKLVDLNRDHQPDFIRLFPGGYEVLPNESTADAYHFGQPISGVLDPPFSHEGFWVHDFNGDGIPDLIARIGGGGGGLFVWYGLGGYRFQTHATEVSLVMKDVGNIPNLERYQFTFFDSNNDGMTDIVLTEPGYTMLFINQGSVFTMVPVDAFERWNGLHPVVLDASGRGNTEVIAVHDDKAYAVDLTFPGLGLLHTADDGKGTVIEYTYKRAAPEVGVRYRNSLLDKVTITSTGYDPVTYEYDYEKPTLHTLGKFLLGYRQVTRRAPLSTDAMTFLHEDHHAGLMLADITLDDLHRGAKRVTFRQYEDAQFRGIPWKRLASEGKGWESTNPLSPAVALEQSDYLEYEDEVCPREVRQTNAHGTVTTLTEYTHLPEFESHVMCMDARIVMTSADAYPFTHEAEFARNARGQLASVTVMGPDGPIVEQEIDYTPNGQVKSLGSPGKGRSIFQYTPETGLLQSVLSPDQVLTEVTKRDPVTDSILTMRTVRGPSLVHTQHYRFDGQERLVTSWDDLGHASESMPNETLAYRYAQGNMPGRILVRKLIDAAAHHYAESAELMTAAGDPLAMMTRIPEGWRVSELTSRSRVTGTTSSWVHPSALLHGPDATVEGLFAAAHVTGTSKASSFEIPSVETTMFHEDVTQTLERRVSVIANGVVHATTENDRYKTRTVVDPSGRVMESTNQGGAATGAEYDALGRLRKVTLADGATHRTTYDPYGRIARIDRDAVGAVVYQYTPVTSHLAKRSYFGVSSAPIDEVPRRSVMYTHDPIGRVTEESHEDASGAQQRFRFYHDGATPSDPGNQSARGLLTAAEGEGYTKEWAHRPDGSVKTYALTIEGFRTIATTLGYADDGSVRDRAVVVTDMQGARIHHAQETQLRDAWGRAFGSTRDGLPFASYGYDIRGLPNFATFAGPLTDGEGVTFQHDAHTLAQSGINQHSTQWRAAVSHRMNARGLVDHENITLPQTEIKRKYGYSPEGYLADATDPMGRSEYTYDPVGLPKQVTTDTHGSDEVRSHQRSGNVLSAGAHHHRFDALGRAVERDDVNIEYGPNGQIKRASRGGKSWDYLHDEGGHRLAKRVNGEVVAAYLEGGAYLDATSFTEAVRAMGVLVGILKHDSFGKTKFHMVAADARGTLLTDTDGTPRIPSPFGDRATRPDISAAIDYAAKGYDADLGTVRMGVRDYDPVLGRFLTPDPLFLEALEKCIENSTSCNLYTYARNNPLAFVDPDGTDDAFLIVLKVAYYVSEAMKNDFRDQREALDRIDFVELADGVALIAGGVGTIIGGGGGSGALAVVGAPFTFGLSVPAGGASAIAAVGVGSTSVLVGGALVIDAMSGNHHQMAKLDGANGDAPLKGVGGSGWRGDKQWKDAVKEIHKGGDVRSLNGKVPNEEEAKALIGEAKGAVERVDKIPHASPNPHTYPHINYTTANGTKGTVEIILPK